MPKREIYKKLIHETGIKMSLSSFYKYCKKSFKKPVKKTGLCPICKNGFNLKKKSGQIQLNKIEKKSINSEITLYEQHLKLS